MSGPASPTARQILTLTPRQRRLRIITGVILVIVVVMVGMGMTHPFFRTVGSPAVVRQVRAEVTAERRAGSVRKPWSQARRAVTAKLVVLYLYWIVCFLMALSLVIVAWLDVREVRRKLLMARRDMWKETVEEMRQRLNKPSDS